MYKTNVIVLLYLAIFSPVYLGLYSVYISCVMLLVFYRRYVVSISCFHDSCFVKCVFCFLCVSRSTVNFFYVLCV